MLWIGSKPWQFYKNVSLKKNAPFITPGYLTSETVSSFGIPEDIQAKRTGQDTEKCQGRISVNGEIAELLN